MGKPKPFDLLAMFGKFGLERKLALTDSETRAAFGLHVAQAVDQALADPALLHGQRAEAMFEAMLASLGDFRLVKPEDGWGEDLHRSCDGKPYRRREVCDRRAAAAAA